MLWQSQILLIFMPFLWIPLWLHHIQVNTEFSSAKQYQSPFVLSSSVAFNFTLFALSPLACYLCFLSNVRQSLYQDPHNLLANTESQAEKEAVTNYLRIHAIQGLVFKKQYIQSWDYTEVILYENTMYGILKWNNVVYSFISHRKDFLYIQPNLDFPIF